MDGDEEDINANKIETAVGTTGSSTVVVTKNIDDQMAVGVVNVAVTADDSKKSERKRKRERQRRSDLASAFEELSTLVIQIDPDQNDPQTTTDTDGAAIPSSTISSSSATMIRDQGITSSAAIANRKGHTRRKSSGDAETSADLDGSGMTRLDLIGRTTMLLRRLQRENVDLRRRLEDYKKGRTGGSGSSSSGNVMAMGGHNDDMEVLVMVPTLTPSDHFGPDLRGPAGSYPPQQPPVGGSRGYYMYPPPPTMELPSQSYGGPQQPLPPSHNPYYHHSVPGYSSSHHHPHTSQQYISGGSPWGTDGSETTMNLSSIPHHHQHHLQQHQHQYYPGMDNSPSSSSSQQPPPPPMRHSSSPSDDVTRTRSSPNH